MAEGGKVANVLDWGHPFGLILKISSSLPLSSSCASTTIVMEPASQRVSKTTAGFHSKRSLRGPDLHHIVSCPYNGKRGAKENGEDGGEEKKKNLLFGECRGEIWPWRFDTDLAFQLPRRRILALFFLAVSPHDVYFYRGL